MTHFSSIDEYIAAQPEAVQGVLQRIRRIIHRALPGAEEVISYNIPAFTLSDGPVVWMAGWKEHYSLYPVNGSVAGQLKEQLEPYELGKGTLRLPLSQPVPEKLIARLAKLLARERRARTPTASLNKEPIPDVPPALMSALKKEPRARAAFERLAPSHRKAYVQWVSEAKREETRDRRARSAVQKLISSKSPARSGR